MRKGAEGSEGSKRLNVLEGILGKQTAELSLGRGIGFRKGRDKHCWPLLSLSSGFLLQHPAVSRLVPEENDVEKLVFCRRFII